MPAGPAKRSRKRGAVPIVRPPEGDPELLREMQSVRTKLGGRDGSVGASAHANCKTRPYKGDRWECLDHHQYFRVEV